MVTKARSQNHPGIIWRGRFKGWGRQEGGVLRFQPAHPPNHVPQEGTSSVILHIRLYLLRLLSGFSWRAFADWCTRQLGPGGETSAPWAKLDEPRVGGPGPPHPGLGGRGLGDPFQGFSGPGPSPLWLLFHQYSPPSPYPLPPSGPMGSTIQSWGEGIS